MEGLFLHDVLVEGDLVCDSRGCCLLVEFLLAEDVFASAYSGERFSARVTFWSKVFRCGFLMEVTLVETVLAGVQKSLSLNANLWEAVLSP